MEPIQLSTNSPNPFNAKTQIAYQVPDNVKDTQLIVYNVRGQQMKRYDLQTGKSSVEIDGSNWKPGTYLYVVVIDPLKKKNILLSSILYFDSLVSYIPPDTIFIDTITTGILNSLKMYEKVK